MMEQRFEHPGVEQSRSRVPVPFKKAYPAVVSAPCLRLFLWNGCYLAVGSKHSTIAATGKKSNCIPAETRSQ